MLFLLRLSSWMQRLLSCIGYVFRGDLLVRAELRLHFGLVRADGSAVVAALENDLVVLESVHAGEIQQIFGVCVLHRGH